MPFSPNELPSDAALMGAALGVIGKLLVFLRADKRRWGLAMIPEFATACILGWIGLGLVDYLNLHGFTAAGVIIGMGYFGTKTIDTLLDISIEYLRKKTGVTNGKDTSSGN